MPPRGRRRARRAAGEADDAGWDEVDEEIAARATRRKKSRMVAAAAAIAATDAVGRSTRGEVVQPLSDSRLRAFRRKVHSTRKHLVTKVDPPPSFIITISRAHVRLMEPVRAEIAGAPEEGDLREKLSPSCPSRRYSGEDSRSARI